MALADLDRECVTDPEAVLAAPDAFLFLVMGAESVALGSGVEDEEELRAEESGEPVGVSPGVATSEPSTEGASCTPSDD